MTRRYSCRDQNPPEKKGAHNTTPYLPRVLSPHPFPPSFLHSRPSKKGTVPILQDFDLLTPRLQSIARPALHRIPDSAVALFGYVRPDEEQAVHLEPAYSKS